MQSTIHMEYWLAWVLSTTVCLLFKAKKKFPIVGNRPLYCEMFSSIHDHYQLDAKTLQYLLLRTENVTEKCNWPMGQRQHEANCPLGKFCMRWFVLRVRSHASLHIGSFLGPGIEPAPPALKAQSLNHWNAREDPEFNF